MYKRDVEGCKSLWLFFASLRIRVRIRLNLGSFSEFDLEHVLPKACMQGAIVHELMQCKLLRLPTSLDMMFGLHRQYGSMRFSRVFLAGSQLVEAVSKRITVYRF